MGALFIVLNQLSCVLIMFGIYAMLCFVKLGNLLVVSVKLRTFLFYEVPFLIVGY